MAGASSSAAGRTISGTSRREDDPSAVIGALRQWTWRARSTQDRRDLRAPDGVSGGRHVQAVADEQLAARTAVGAEHRREDVDERLQRVARNDLAYESVRLALLVDQVPTGRARLEADENDARVRQRVAHHLDESAIVGRDPSWSPSESQVVVAFVEHDRARAKRQHGPRQIVNRLGERGASEATVHYGQSLEVARERSPEPDRRAAVEHDAARCWWRDAVRRLEGADLHLGAINRDRDPPRGRLCGRRDHRARLRGAGCTQQDGDDQSPTRLHSISTSASDESGSGYFRSSDSSVSAMQRATR